MYVTAIATVVGKEARYSFQCRFYSRAIKDSKHGKIVFFVLDQILRIFMAVARSDIEVRLNTVSWLVSTD